MTIAEKIAEWRKGCSCSTPTVPEKCEECTKALIESIEREESGYRALLVKYMAVVIDNEGTTFVEFDRHDILTEEESAALNALEPEAFDLFNGR